MRLPDRLRILFSFNHDFSFVNVILILAIIIFAISYFFMAGPYWNITSDSYEYFMAGKSLHETGSYRVDGRPLTVVPFVFPGLLAIIFSIFGDSFFISNLFMKILVLLCIILTFLLLKQRGLSNSWSLFVTLLVASSIHMFDESTRILSDIPFTFFSFLAILFFNQYTKRKSCSLLSLAIFFIIVSYFTKTIGLALMVASLLYLFIEFIKSPEEERVRKKRVFLTVLFCFLVPAIAWEVRNFISGGRYLHYFRAFIEKAPWVPEYATPVEIVKRTFLNYVPFKLKPLVAVFGNYWPKKVFSSPYKFILTFIYSVLAIMLYLGVIIDIIKNKSFTGLYLFSYLFIYSVMNMYGGGARYLIPILPFILFYPFFFIRDMFLLKKKRIEEGAVFQIIALLFLVFYIRNAIPYLKYHIKENHRPLFSGTFIKHMGNPDEQDLSLWLKTNTENSVICLSENFKIDCLISERKFYNLPYINDQRFILNYIKSKKVSYVIMVNNSPRVKRFLLPVIMNNKNLFEPLIEKKHASLFKVKERE